MKFLKRMLSYIAVIIIVIATSGVGRSQSVDENISETLLSSSYNQEDYTDFIFDGQRNEKQGKEKKKGTKEVVDTDGDGVPDNEDLCPYVPGTKKAQGCPDKDDDGVPDFMDECPDKAGLPELKGCPDQDGDGIPDHKDKCPTEKGPLWNNGCPIEKSMNDGRPFHALTDNNNKVVDSILSKDSQVTEVFTPRKDIFYYGLDPGKDPNYYQDLAISLEREMEERKKAENEVKKRESTTSDIPSNNNTNLENGTKPKDNPEKQTKLWKVSQRDIILSNDEIKALDEILNNLEFVAGRMNLVESSYIRLDQFADLLNKKYSWKVVFNCYTNEGGNDYRNLNLASNRCQHVISTLRSKGIEQNRLKTGSHGSSTNGNNRFEVEITR